jgi:hypothetical protein
MATIETDRRIEEVYFGKAKDVVGDLRSQLYLISETAEYLTNTTRRPGTIKRNE